jgi:ParB-like chromosome segregation protein Spo0J
LSAKKRVPETEVAVDIQIERWSIERLIPQANNPRTRSREQVASIAASIREFGFTNPILVGAEDDVLGEDGRRTICVVEVRVL